MTAGEFVKHVVRDNNQRYGFERKIEDSHDSKSITALDEKHLRDSCVYCLLVYWSNTSTTDSIKYFYTTKSRNLQQIKDNN